MAGKQTAIRRGRPVLALGFVGRRVFGVTQARFSRLVLGHKRLGLSEPNRVNRS